MEETLGAFDALIRDGKVRYVAASNFSRGTARRGAPAVGATAVSRRTSLSSPSTTSSPVPTKGALRDGLRRHSLSCVPYFALAMGFLTGKYRPGGEPVDSPRASGAGRYLDERGIAVLEALDEIAADRATTVPAVALAWLAAQPTVAAPIASARTPEQLADLLPMAELVLTSDELERLTTASSGA